MIREQATEETVEALLPKAEVIHLATHGLLSNYTVSEAEGTFPGAVALTPSGQDDGLLTGQEIVNLKINAELVVLSACQTALGDVTNDGVNGLAKAFLIAGAPSIIVSFWSVPDDSTAFLMNEFYKNLELDLSKAAALRQAMLTTMEKYPDPRSWAAFTLIGEASR